MSRPLRIQYPDAWYHVMNRGRRHEVIFPGRQDYERFVELLQASSTMFNVRIAAFCLMPNHYHLLVQTPDANLSRLMRHVDGVYTQRFNRLHECDGSLFRGRYKAIVVEADTYLLDLVRYIHRNPLRGGLVTRLDHYPWSSHRAYLSRAARWSWLYSELALSMLCPTGEDSAKAYRAFVAQEESDELTAALSRRNVPSLLGSKEFVGRVKAGFQSLRSHREIPASRSLAPGLEEIQSAVCASFELDRKELLSSRRGMSNDARNVAIYLARRLSGQTLAAIGVAFGLENYSSVSSVVCRMEQRIGKDRSLRRQVEAIERRIL
ncbi:MAG: transposase [Thermodesulfobacteriota bacterium]